MHSSRVRTARLLMHPGGLHRGGQHPGGVCIWGRGVCLGGAASRGVCRRGSASRPPPPVNRMTHRCKNITFLRTSFAGGKNTYADPYDCRKYLKLDPHKLRIRICTSMYQITFGKSKSSTYSVFTSNNNLSTGKKNRSCVTEFCKGPKSSLFLTLEKCSKWNVGSHPPYRGSWIRP